MADSGFIKAQSGNIPKIDSSMVFNFFSGHEDFVGAEFRSRKIEWEDTVITSTISFTNNLELGLYVI